jgi:FHA domain
MGSDEDFDLPSEPRRAPPTRRKPELEVFDFRLDDDVRLGDPPPAPPMAHRTSARRAPPPADMTGDPFELSEGDGGIGDELQEAGYCRVVGGDFPVASSSVDRPLLIGSHPRCTVHLPGPAVAPMHCFLSWLPRGLYLFDLNSGQGTLLDDKPIRFALVRDGQTITVGSRTLRVELKGTPTEPAARRQIKKPTTLAITAVQGKHKGASAVLACGQPMVVGQAATCDLRLDSEKKLLPRHVELTVEYDQNAPGGFVVRLRRLAPGRRRARQHGRHQRNRHRPGRRPDPLQLHVARQRHRAFAALRSGPPRLVSAWFTRSGPGSQHNSCLSPTLPCSSRVDSSRPRTQSRRRRSRKPFAPKRSRVPAASPVARRSTITSRQ